MAARKAPLRAVGDDEKAPAAKRLLTIVDAADGGDRRDLLVAMRKRIASASDDPNIRGADLAALSRRLLEISKEIEAIDARDHEDCDEAEVPDEDWAAV